MTGRLFAEGADRSGDGADRSGDDADGADLNWAGNYRFTAPRLVEPQSVAELAAVIRQPGPVRALGTRHSFNDIADTSGTLISTAGLPAGVEIDADARLATVGAGMRYGIAARALQEHGWALHNMGSLPHISIGGAVATGTHGSGNTNGTLSSAVHAIEYVDHRGELVVADRSHPDFGALVVAAGAFGVTTRLTLDIQPSYLVQQDAWDGIAWADFLADPDALLGSGYSVSVLTHWGVPELEHVWGKTRLSEEEAAVGLSPERSLLGGIREPAGVVLEPNLTERGIPGPWNERLPHFRLETVPSRGEELQTEYFVRRSDAAAALSAVRELAAVIDPLLALSEFRTVAADEQWLSGAHGRDTLAIHFTWLPDDAGVRAVLPLIERALEPFGARPHWGKLHLFDADRIAAVVPRLADARAVYERLDPESRFANAHLRRLGIR